METTTLVKERPILFKGAMVRALLDGTKTQTRRAIKVQPPEEGYRISTLMSTTGDRRNIGRHQWVKMNEDGYSIESAQDIYFACPYGQPGDQLWVRETWNTDGDYMDYRADYNDGKPTNLADAASMPPDWKPSIFMPRWASRILLEIVSVRVERLQAISESDAVAEGIEVVYRDGPDVFYKRYSQPGKWHKQLMPTQSYQTLWESINGPGSWEANPWVWVVEFKVVTPPQS